MNIETIGYEELQDLYAVRLREDFPPTELRPLSNMKRLLDQGAYRCFVCREEDLTAAYALFAVSGGAALLDYYAVEKALRGQGIGGEFLARLREKGEDFGVPYFLIEAESLESAEDQEEMTERQRRLRFYHRCGCVSTGVYSHLFGVEYAILALPMENFPAPSPEQARTALESVYSAIVPVPPGPERDRLCRCFFKSELYPE